MWGVRRRFYCVNFAGCEYARRPHVYDAAAFRRQPSCCGVRGDGCGHPLVEGRSIDRRGWLLAAGLGLCAAAWWTRQVYFPAPLPGIAFEAAATQITAPAAQAQVALVRQGDVSAAAQVHYRTEDGSAKAGIDYVAAEGRVAFAPGERRIVLRLATLPAGTPREDETDRRFTVVLANVQGYPVHTVVIGVPQPSAESLTQAETLVRALSGLALDVASLYVKIDVAKTIMGSSAAGAEERRHYADRLQTLVANSEQARRRYAALAGELCGLDRRSVARGFTAWAQKLEQQTLRQQRDATLIAQQQVQRFCRDSRADLEEWARQLSQAIPRPAAAPART